MIYTITDFGIVLGFKVSETKEEITLNIQKIISKCCSTPMTGKLIFSIDEIFTVKSIDEHFDLDPTKPKYLVEFSDKTAAIKSDQTGKMYGTEMKKICENCGEFVIDGCCGNTFSEKEMIEEIIICRQSLEKKRALVLQNLLSRFPKKPF